MRLARGRQQILETELAELVQGQVLVETAAFEELGARRPGEAEERVDGRRGKRPRERREDGAGEVVLRGVAVRRRQSRNSKIPQAKGLLDSIIVDDDDDAHGSMHRRRQGRRGDGRWRRAPTTRLQANRREPPAAGVAGALRGRRVRYGSEGKAAAGLARLPSRPERFRHTSGGAGQS